MRPEFNDVPKVLIASSRQVRDDGECVDGGHPFWQQVVMERVPLLGQVPANLESVSLRSTSDDPAAVAVDFWDVGNGANRWWTSRSVLRGALTRKDGAGDLTASPWGKGRRGVKLALSSPSGQASVVLSAMYVRAFLERVDQEFPDEVTEEDVDGFLTDLSKEDAS